MKELFKDYGIFIIGGIIIILILVSIFSISIIPTGYIGVKTKFGAIEDKIYTSGIHFKMIFRDKIVKLNSKITRVDTEGEGASKDLQTVNLYLATNYKINTEKGVEIYKNLGENYEENIIKPMIQEVSKTTISTFTAEELITNRSKVSSEITRILNEKLNEKGFIIDSVSIVNLNFSEAYNTAIEQKQVAEQETKKAQLELEKTKIQGEAKVIEAQKEKEANELKNATLTREILQEKAIEKWNGTLPTTITSDVMKLLEN